jgi:hypothetical protein
MNKKVHIVTTTRQIISSGKQKPTSPIWEFVNTGSAVIIINQNYKLLPGEKFGVSMDAVVSYFLEKGIPVVSDTEFEVDFLNASAAPGDFQGKQRGLGHIIEVSVNYL